MNLVFEIVGQHAPSLAAERRKVFGVGGGSIGRAPECDWVLASPYVSRHHATVCCINGVFYIESTGENGVAVNAPQSMLPQLERRALKNGDRLFIDEFEIGVAVSGAQSAASDEDFDDESPNDLSDADREEFPADLPLGAPDDSLDPLKGLTARASTTTAPRDDSPWNHSSSLADHFTPPPIAPSASPSSPFASPAMPIAEDWNTTDDVADDDASGHTRTIGGSASLLSPPDASSASSASSSAPLTPGRASILFASGANVSSPERPHFARPAESGDPGRSSAEPSRQTPESGARPAAEIAPPQRAASVDAPQIGAADPETRAIIRSITQGLIEVLRARADFRNEFRLPVTRVRSAENNPLKFAINADDALDSLSSRRNVGFMQAPEAFDDAFEDIRAHQLAMLAGMRAGFEQLMNRFDPQKLQERFDRQLKHTGFLAVAAKMRYWDLYADLFEELASDADGAFQKLFGEEFASAYEKQLETLRRNRGGPRY